MKYEVLELCQCILRINRVNTNPVSEAFAFSSSANTVPKAMTLCTAECADSSATSFGSHNCKLQI